jgi:transposase InsO family protein
VEHGVSRSWFYKIRAQARSDGMMRAVEPTSTRPRSSPNRTRDDVVLLVVKIRTQLQEEGLDYGPLSVLGRLRRMGFTEPPSRATLSRIFAQSGMVPAEPKKKPRSAYRRFVYPAPNCLWQIDATEWTLANGVGCVIFQLVDDHSRLALASLVAPGETSDAAVEVVKLAVERHGAPQKFLSDNGVALNPSRRGYTSRLVDYLHTLGVETITGKPYKPTTQGKNERFHRTLHKYLNARPPAGSIDQLQVLVDEFDRLYNTEREHQALAGHSTPLEAWTRTTAAPAPIPPPTALEILAEAHAARATPPGEAMLTVRSGGRTHVLGIEFRLGNRYIGQQVHALWDHRGIEFFDFKGTLILGHPMPPQGTRHVGIGSHQRISNTLSTKS